MGGSQAWRLMGGVTSMEIGGGSQGYRLVVVRVTSMDIDGECHIHRD